MIPIACLHYLLLLYDEYGDAGRYGAAEARNHQLVLGFDGGQHGRITFMLCVLYSFSVIPYRFCMPKRHALSKCKNTIIFRTAKPESQNAIAQREETRSPTLRTADVRIAYGCFRYVDKTILCCLTSEAKSAVAFWGAACFCWYGKSLEKLFQQSGRGQATTGEPPANCRGAACVRRGGAPSFQSFRRNRRWAYAGDPASQTCSRIVAILQPYSGQVLGIL